MDSENKDNVIERLSAVENAVTAALENEDYAAAERLNAERDALIKELMQTFAKGADAQDGAVPDLAGALAAHGRKAAKQQSEERQAARAEILHSRESQA